MNTRGILKKDTQLCQQKRFAICLKIFLCHSAGSRTLLSIKTLFGEVNTCVSSSKSLNYRAELERARARRALGKVTGIISAFCALGSQRARILRNNTS